MRVTKVTVRFGATVSTGNFEFIKPEFEVTVNCDENLGAIGGLFDDISEEVRAKLQEEVRAIRGE